MRYIKIIFMSFLFTVTLFANEKIINPLNKINLSLNDDTKLLVDCSYKEKKLFGFIGGYFTSKEYSKFENINSLLNIVCGSKHSQKYEIELKDLYNAAKMVIKQTDDVIDFSTNAVLGSKKSDLFDKEIYYKITFIENSSYREDDGFEYFLVTSFENSKLEVEQEYLNDDKVEQNYLIKTYKYDTLNKNVSFLIDRPLELMNPITYTNTYDIDEMSECINGKIWIKKYKNTAGDNCNWIKK